MVSLKKIRSVTLADGVEDAILEYIRSGNMKEGDALPKEEELAGHLNVSRHIVREGLSRLKTLGLIESRRRKGMTLTRPNVFGGVSKLASAKLFSSGERNELMGMRVILELGMVDFIFRRKTPEDLRTLRGLVEMEVNGGISLGNELEFHSCLFRIGGNAMASQFRDILTEAFQTVERKEVKSSADSTVPASHKDICDALEHGSCEDFRQTMYSHFKPYVNW